MTLLCSDDVIVFVVLFWFVGNRKKEMLKKKKPPSYQFAIKHGLFDKQTNKPGKKRTKNSETMRFFRFVSLSLPPSSNSLICHSHSRCSCSHYMINFYLSLTRCETFIYNILNTTRLELTRVQHGFDMMSSFFFQVISERAAHQLEWAHQNERCNN